MTTSYQSVLLRELAKSRRMNFQDNFDRANQGEEPPPPPSGWKAGLAETRRQLDVSYGQPMGERFKSLRPLARAASYYLQPSRYFSREYSEEIARGEFLYGLLADERSRDLLVKLVAYKILGHRKVKLPRNTPKYWQDIDAMAELRTSAPPMPIKFMDAKLAVYDLRPLGYDVTCHATQAGLACTVVQKQYEYHQGNVHCKAYSGDVVIDAGGCWGETTMYFANEAGPTGAVVSFEFIPSNLAVLHRNQDLNPHLRGRVHLVEKPIWSSSGLKLYYVDWGPGSRVTHDINKYASWEGMVETITIDETLAGLGLPRVDFIKMDIEGAELNALRGAEASIRRHRPKLAISLYHNPEDIETIPRYLSGLGLGYRFYLDHHTIYQNETVLFAVPVDRT
jgi:FkbM family methyltransferase